ncbi:hypothetical protein CA234_18890 [Sphingomonas sp. ABOLE]|jgi:hypothetical protein|uniref:PRTRC system protein F n=1 Tax=Sphingomonas paucimobilis TaxID=13689 RepID=A0A7Y2KVL1_SPHPI|nr:hypothetical protein XM50_02680 [Sphingomonas sp. Ag1]NNG59686.1 hypothetical protein [Sphingomonas paucimobilis]RSV35939.1 hypothetical protein CA234_18890 [Sphingomonas sp. ABOLE]
MATLPALPDHPATRRPRPSTSRSSSTRHRNTANRPSPSSLPTACDCPRSADLAGRSVVLSREIPVSFDQPLARHHKLIGGWVASRDQTARRCTRAEARRRIERVFDKAVLDILRPLELAELRVAVLNSEDMDAPAIAIVCDSMGQLDLGWIETSDAQIGWRAAAYTALARTMGSALPIFGYDDLFEEISMYYWDGEIEDKAARDALVAYHGADPEDLEDTILPSDMNDRRPDWMIAANAAPLRSLPNGLRSALRNLRCSHRALRALPDEKNAWHFDGATLHEYLPDLEECSSLPPLTLVPVEQFAREVDDVARHGMEYGFMDIAGLCPLPDAARVTDWFASLEAGARLLLAAQELIQLDPDTL